MESKPYKKKRVHPPRKIVPRGRMGIQWIIGPVIIAGIILIAGTIFLIVKPQ
ncbi:MAG TPA: hypothetical protein VGB64_00405 [Actinomycetota bacterium]